MSLNVLSQLLVVSQANITGVTDSLVRKGLVTRTEHPQDRRVILARITKKGQERLASFMPTYHRLTREIAAPLTRDEKETLIRILTKVRNGLINRYHKRQ
jgi:DNA-binding MarR family transcriptional regulator